MATAARVVAAEAGRRQQTLLKAKRFFTTPELVRFFNAEMLSYLESGTPGIYNAALSILSCIDRVQSRFFCEICRNET